MNGFQELKTSPNQNAENGEFQPLQNMPFPMQVPNFYPTNPMAYAQFQQNLGNNSQFGMMAAYQMMMNQQMQFGINHQLQNSCQVSVPVPSKPASIKKTHVNSDIMFVDCEAEDTIDGESLHTIIGYAMSQMGINGPEDNDTSTIENSKIANSGDFKEHAFEKYSKSLEKKLGKPEPHYKSLFIKEHRRETIIKEMNDLLPQKVKQFETLIEKAADKAVAILDMSAKDVGQLIWKTQETEIVLSEFVVLKIFRSGENLEIIPCYMKVSGKKKEGKFTIFSWSDVESSMEYKQHKYVIHKYKIKAIIRAVKAQENEEF